MTRFLSLPLLLVLVLPLFAQFEAPEPGQSLPRDPALLMRMREQLTSDLQQIQQMLGFVTDPQLIETLKAQQADLTKQLLEITQQQAAGQQTTPRVPNMRTPEVPPGQQPTSPRGGMMSPRTPEPPVSMPVYPDPRGGNHPMMAPGMPRNEHYPNPMQPIPPGMITPGMMSSVPQMPGYESPGFPNPGGFSPQPWGDPDRMWDATPWGPRLPKELLETKQSVDSLRKEIADLKETVKALETQIQLLTRNILLERVKEKENAPAQ